MKEIKVGGNEREFTTDPFSVYFDMKWAIFKLDDEEAIPIVQKMLLWCSIDNVLSVMEISKNKNNERIERLISKVFSQMRYEIMMRMQYEAFKVNGLRLFTVPVVGKEMIKKKEWYIIIALYAFIRSATFTPEQVYKYVSELLIIVNEDISDEGKVIWKQLKKLLKRVEENRIKEK